MLLQHQQQESPAPTDPHCLKAQHQDFNFFFFNPDPALISPDCQITPVSINKHIQTLQNNIVQHSIS